MNDSWIAFDFETSSQNRYACKIDRVCVCSFDMKGRTSVLDYSMRGNVTGTLADVMSLPFPKVAHNAAFDLYLMEHRLGIKVAGEVHDTYLMAKHWRNDLPAYDLKSLSWWLFGDLYTPLTKLRQWIHEHNMKGEDDIEFDMTQCPDKLVHNYCTHDVEMTAKLTQLLYPKVCDNYAYKLDTKAIRLTMEAEAAGITIDTEFYKRFRHLGKRRINRNLHTASEIMEVPEGRKPTGNALRERLAERGETRRTLKGRIKADEVVLRDHKDDRGIRAVVRVRTDQKQVSTYVENILAAAGGTGKFHPNLRQSAAITRRYRSSDFHGDNGVITKGNVQNFPRGEGIRSGIIVPKGYAFVKLDLASIEARLGAHAMSVFLDFDFYCKKYKADDKFNIYLHVIEEHTDHGKVSKKDPLYTAYKHGCLGIQYGVGVRTFHRTMVDNFELPYTLEECNHIYQTIRHECPEFVALQRAVSSLVEEQGYVEDDFGARYYVPEGAYKGVNYYCQGCAGNVLKWWWGEVDELMEGTKDYVFNTVHDELDAAVMRGRAAEGRVRAYCDTLKELDLFDLPITAETSGLVENWGVAG
ncbi:MAG: DNA polymerase [Candidatus Paceibacterota bacterium]|jgi:DNA polymerase I-like protein with 3'-5' exonuclease and polymerase domains